MRVASQGSSAPAFVPTSVSGCVLWLRADLGRTMNGGTVSAWADQSGTGDANKNMAQGTAASQPTYVAADAAYNNQPVLSFDVDDFMLSGVWASKLTQPCTWYVVGHTTLTSGAFVMDGIDGTDRQAVFASSSAPYDWRMFAGGTVLSGVDINVPAVVACSFNGASSAIYVNTITTASATGDAVTQSLAGLTLGQSWGGSGNGWGGPIAEAIGFTGVHNATNRGLIMNYLAARYGIAVAA